MRATTLFAQIRLERLIAQIAGRAAQHLLISKGGTGSEDDDIDGSRQQVLVSTCS